MDNFDSIKELFSKTISQANSQVMNPIEYGVAEKPVQRNTILFKALVQYLFNSSTIFKICATMSL